MSNTNERRRRQRPAKRESSSFLDRFAFLRAGAVLSVASEDVGRWCGGAGVDAGAVCVVDGAGTAALALPLSSLGPNGIAMGWTRLTC